MRLGLERAEMSESDDLVSRPGVIMAGRFGRDGRIAEHKSAGLYLEDPAAMEMAHWFCSAATMMFEAMAAAMDRMEAAGSWRPMAAWFYTGGDYAITVYHDKFVFAESGKVKSFDEIRELLHHLDS
jgi:roadblock/LC7 domain-containing protein